MPGFVSRTILTLGLILINLAGSFGFAPGKRELERLRIGGLMFVPELKKVYEY